jgi:competence protein ComEA
MNFKEVIAGYFSFTRKEKTGILVLLFLVLAALFFPKITTLIAPPTTTVTDSSWIAAIRELEIADTISRDKFSGYVKEEQDDDIESPGDQYLNVRQFPFDPNTLAADQWRELGIRPRTIQTIQNYLARGGRFRSPADLAKIYGFRNDDFQRLERYIQISSPNARTKETSENVHYDSRASDNSTHRSFPAIAPIEINTADTAAFIRLPGIGPTLASRILKFREKLGGFYAIEQIRETFGLADSTFQKIRPLLRVSPTEVKKIRINTADKETLQAHPYIRYTIANAIISYRNQHGPFNSPEALKNVMLITDEVLNRLNPYISLDP